jgi:hypothetical protein
MKPLPTAKEDLISPNTLPDSEGAGRWPSRLGLGTALGTATSVVALLAIIVLNATGLFAPAGTCPGASNLLSISGTVSFEGRLIPRGMIEIVPLP